MKINLMLHFRNNCIGHNLLSLLNQYKEETQTLYEANVLSLLFQLNIFKEQNHFEAHLRVRKRDVKTLKSFLPPRNCSTYWQVMREDSAISGELVALGAYLLIYFVYCKMINIWWRFKLADLAGTYKLSN